MKESPAAVEEKTPSTWGRACSGARPTDEGGMEPLQTRAEGIRHQQFYGLRNVTELLQK